MRAAASGTGLIALGCVLGTSGASTPAAPAPLAARAALGRVAIEHFAFAPPDVRVTVGDSVVWVNNDAFGHTTTADSAAWSSPELGRGQRFLFVTTRPGRFPYHCAAHPVMRGALIVETRP